MNSKFPTVEVILDETQFGSADLGLGPRWNFYAVRPDGTREFITQRSGNGSRLVAVTKDQFRAWSSWKITSESAE